MNQYTLHPQSKQLSWIGLEFVLTDQENGRDYIFNKS